MSLKYESRTQIEKYEWKKIKFPWINRAKWIDEEKAQKGLNNSKYIEHILILACTITG